MRQTYEVCAPDVPPVIDNPVLQHVVYNDGFSRWRELLLLQTASDLIGGFLGRMESEKTIKQQLQEKELLIRETHHRIKNNIASIYGLLNFQAETVENKEAHSILYQAISRINSMQPLYDKMLSAEDIRVVSVASYVKRRMLAV
jgi:hypothetical protein